MKRKRIFIFAASIAACVALTLVLHLFLDARTGITKANFGREDWCGKQGNRFLGDATAVYWPERGGYWVDSTETIGDKLRRLIGWPWWK
jgi:hypothetical protein